MDVDIIVFCNLKQMQHFDGIFLEELFVFNRDAAILNAIAGFINLGAVAKRQKVKKAGLCLLLVSFKTCAENTGQELLLWLPGNTVS